MGELSLCPFVVVVENSLPFTKFLLKAMHNSGYERFICAVGSTEKSGPIPEANISLLEIF